MPRKAMFLCFATILAAGLHGCSEAPSEPSPPTSGTVELRAAEVVNGLQSPVFLTAPPSDPRLFIVEQPGRIRIVENGQLLSTPFLDIRSRVTAGGERGLLGLAFHPDYARNGYFYVNYTDNRGDTRVERFRVSADWNRADPASAQLLLMVEQPFSNHNGGMVAFGSDGMLYIGMGDGGSGGDPLGHGQNPQTLLGALLRIDVNRGTPYAIPANNPYATGSAGRPEIWANGLRNPWRFSFDAETGYLYVGDVGQNRREEINAVPAGTPGLNFGWDIMEGSLCHEPSSGCTQANLVKPVHEYPNRAEGCSVAGGYVYRGRAIPQLQGVYFYGDYCEGFVKSFRLASGGTATDHRTWDLGSLGNITSFGQDANGEIYVIAQQGRVYRLTAP